MRYKWMNLGGCLAGLFAAVLAVGPASQPALAQVVPPSARAHFTGDYTKYVVPHQCLGAMERETRFVWRAPALRDTLSVRAAIIADTLPTSAVRAGRLCLARLRAETLRPGQVTTLAQARFTAREDSIARTLLSRARQQRQHMDSAEWAWLRDKMFSMHNAVRPRRGQVLAAVFDEIIEPDSMRMAVKLDFRFEVMGRLASEGDFDAAARVARRGVTDWARGTAEDQQLRLNAHAFLYAPIFDPTLWEARFPAAAMSVLDEMKAAKLPIMEPPSPSDDEYQRAAKRQWALLDSVVRGSVKITAPTLAGDQWFQRTDTAVRPVRGRVTLLVYPGLLYGESGQSSAREIETVAMFKRLHRKYGAAGLEIVWVMQTRGWFRDSKVLAPQAETEAVAKYYFEHLGAPGLMVFEHSQFDVRDDGVRFARPTRNLLQYAAMNTRVSGLPLLLVDRQGHFVFPVSPTGLLIGSFMDQEEMWSKVIERTLKGPAPH